MFHHGTVSGDDGFYGLAAASTDGWVATSSSDGMSYNSSDVEGMMAAGRRAYAREMRAQQLLDREIELSINQHMDNGSGDLETFVQLAELDAIQQNMERDEEDLYYSMLDLQDAEDREQLLFEQEVYPGLLLAEAAWHRPGQETTTVVAPTVVEAAPEPSSENTTGAPSSTDARTASPPKTRP